MSKILQWEWQRINILRMIRRKPQVIVVNVLLILIVCFALVFLFAGNESENDSSEYLIINQSYFNSYDPNYLEKVYLPIPDKKGFLLILSDKVNDKYFELVINPNNRYNIEFWNDNQLVGNLHISRESTLNRVPEPAVISGYNKIVVLPVSGKNFAVVYFQIIDDFDDNVIFQEYEEHRYDKVRGTENVGSPNDITGIIAYLDHHDENTFQLSVSNIGALPLRLVSIAAENKQQEIMFPENQFAAQLDRADPIYQQFDFDNVSDNMMADWRNLYIYYQYENDNEIKKTFVSPFPRRDNQVFNSTIIREWGNTTDFDFIEIVDQGVYFSGDTVIVDSPLIIPNGYRLFIEKGQIVDLVNEAFILSYSPVEIAGTKDDPVMVVSSDDSGQGIAVFQASSPSIIQHAIFDNLSYPQSGIWELTGSIVFYESDVKITHSVFQNNSSEDALNIVRSEFSIDNTQFTNTYGDAFDSDFCQGYITRSRFVNTGNDGLDVSGSIVEISDTTFDQIGDKAISVGERSNVYVEKISIDNAIIGIASKDLSQVYGDQIVISNIHIGYALYQKKPEFGPASIEITNSEMNGYIGLDYLIQNGSHLELNNHQMQGLSKKKEALLLDKLIIGEIIQW